MHWLLNDLHEFLFIIIPDFLAQLKSLHKKIAKQVLIQKKII